MQTRYRVQHRFWLDLKKDEEEQLDEWLHSLKQKRQFVGALRDALRLFFDMKKGKTDVLFELFPFALESRVMQPQMISPLKPVLSKVAAADDDDGDLLVIGRDTSTDSSLNFLNSMMNLQ